MTSLPTTTKNKAPQAKVIQYLNKLYSTPQYKKGTEDYRRQVRESAYNKHLLPFWKKHGIAPPSQEDFISGKTTPIKQESPGFITKAAMGGMEEMQRVASTAQKGIEKVTKVIGGVYQAPGDVPLTKLPEWWKDYSNAYEEGLKRGNLTHYETDKSRKITSDWMGDNIENSLKDQSAKMAGQLAIDYPMFEAAGKVIGLPSKVPGVSGVAARILAKPGGSLALGAIKNASEMYLVSRATGHSSSEASSEAAGVGVLSVAGGIAAKPFKMAYRALFSKVSQSAGPEVIKEGIKEAALVLEGKKTFDPSNPFSSFTEATASILNSKAVELKHKSFYAAPKAVKIKILQDLGYEAANAVNAAALTNTAAVKETISNELKEAVSNNPALAENLASATASLKKFGVDPAKATADMIQEKAKIKTGVKSKRAITRQISEDEKAIDVEVAKLRKEWLTKSNPEEAKLEEELERRKERFRNKGVAPAEPGYSEQTGQKPEHVSKSVGAASATQLRPLGRPLKLPRPPNTIPLPVQLAGAKPKFGTKEISFEGNDLNRALYIVASEGSKAHAQYVEWIKGITGMSDDTVKLAAQEVKSHVKLAAKTSGNKITIFRSYDPFEFSKSTKELIAGVGAKKFDKVEKVKASLKNHPDAAGAVEKVDDTIRKLKARGKK